LIIQLRVCAFIFSNANRLESETTLHGGASSPQHPWSKAFAAASDFMEEFGQEVELAALTIKSTYPLSYIRHITTET
jgi:hypothetical protein